MNAFAFGSAAEFVAHPGFDLPACLILDVELPDMSGLEFQHRIAQDAVLRENDPHIVFITGHGDIPSSVRAIKAGAVDFLVKPLDEGALMLAINTALARNRETRAMRAELAGLRERLSSLTPRELEVLPLVVSGLLNKQAAAELGISENTLQVHRGSIMRKMRAKSFADLVRMEGVLQVAASRPGHPTD
jgi:FixJ family two-component response regulator